MNKVLLALTFALSLTSTSTTTFAKHEKKMEHHVMSANIVSETPRTNESEVTTDPSSIQEVVPFYYEISQTITAADRDILAKIVFLEARDQSHLGQKAVVEVVFNRVLSDEFPNTIEKVIYQKNQFTPASRISYTTPTQEQYDVVDEVLSELYPVLDTGVMFFSMGQYNKYLYDKIGDHYFCYSKKSYEMKKGC